MSTLVNLPVAFFILALMEGCVFAYQLGKLKNPSIRLGEYRRRLVAMCIDGFLMFFFWVNFIVLLIFGGR